MSIENNGMLDASQPANKQGDSVPESSLLPTGLEEQVNKDGVNEVKAPESVNEKPKTVIPLKYFELRQQEPTRRHRASVIERKAK